MFSKPIVSLIAALTGLFVIALSPASSTAAAKDSAADKIADKAALVDLNSATADELEQLPGVGAATAKKIIAGRPYASVDDLSRAGISKATLAKIEPLVTVSKAAAIKAPAKTAPEKDAEAPKVAAGDKVNLNTATEKDLEELPGVGPATAKKIVAGRPYKSFDDLSQAGISKTTLAKIEPLVTVADAAPVKSPARTTPEKDADAPKVAAGDKVDLNTATAKELEELPGVGPATSKKIIAGRPYKSVDDLAKAGISEKELAKLSPLVTVEEAAPAKTRVTSDSEKEAPAKTAEARTPPVKGMVWVNTVTKIYHKEGDSWYGKTKTGKFMTEADAIAAGYTESKQDKKKDKADDAKEDSKARSDSSK